VSAIRHENKNKTGLSNFALKMAVFCGVVPCSLVDTDPHFRGAYCLHYHHHDHHRPDDNEGSKLL
jgi:hypothetical protein